MLELLKDYYVFMLIIMVLSYLVPKNEYKAYIHFFIGIFLVVLFLKPLLEIFYTNDFSYLSKLFSDMNAYIEHIDYESKEENIFEYFFLEGKGE